LRRAGVAEDVSMKISGHRTRAVFARHNITDSTDLHDAMRRVQDFVGTSLAQAAQSGAKK
jgi:site-specific recombinase XerC